MGYDRYRAADRIQVREWLVLAAILLVAAAAAIGALWGIVLLLIRALKG